MGLIILATKVSLSLSFFFSICPSLSLSLSLLLSLTLSRSLSHSLSLSLSHSLSFSFSLCVLLRSVPSHSFFTGDRAMGHFFQIYTVKYDLCNVFMSNVLHVCSK